MSWGLLHSLGTKRGVNSPVFVLKSRLRETKHRLQDSYKHKPEQALLKFAAAQVSPAVVSRGPGSSGSMILILPRRHGKKTVIQSIEKEP